MTHPTRNHIALFSGGGLALFLALFWHPLQHGILTALLLRAEAPSPEVLREAVEQAGDPTALLRRFWRTQRIPDREFVVRYLAQKADHDWALFRALEPIVLEATGDPDLEVREQSFATLARMKHPQLRHLALAQLGDADPAARLLGLQSLRATATSNDVSIAYRFLNDSDPRVVVAASAVLRQATGHDVGLRASHALPQFVGFGTNRLAAPDLPAIAQGVQRWREWWDGHRSDYSGSSAAPPSSGSAVRLATSDFRLRDSTGEPVRLSDYQGKVMLLAFWNWGVPASLDDVPVLNGLSRRYAERLVVLGICVPYTADCHAGHDHAAADQPAGEPPAARPHSGERGQGVGALAGAGQMHYRTLLDPDGTLRARFNVGVLPTYVLIDADGALRRLFAGSRSALVFEAMIAEMLPGDSGARVSRGAQ